MKKTSVEQFEKWLRFDEDESLEFKEAKNQFDNSKGSLFDYCAALANGEGGILILGIQEKPRKVVGSSFKKGTHTRLSQNIWQRINLHVDVEEFYYQGLRILIFHIPKHPAGRRVKSGGKGDKYTYPTRRGESLGEMDDQRTKDILTEFQTDYSASILDDLTLDDLDPTAIDIFRQRWSDKAKNDKYREFDDRKILKNADLISDRGVTYAGLILVGKDESLQSFLPDAEIIFEWRQRAEQTNYDFRKNWRSAFMSIDDEIWQTINARNLRIPFQEGFLQREVWAFHEKSVREAVHNAVMHRDYSTRGRSIFIKASPESFLIESPGGFYPPVTVENCLQEKSWRNRLLAEAMEKVGFAERSSQGLDDIFEQSIRDGKGSPDLTKSKTHAVILSVPAQVKDGDFILYLERISNEKQINLSFEEICELDRIRDKQKTASAGYQKKFLQIGLIEQVGKTRGAKYILSHQYYIHKGKPGMYTRLKGISRDHKKQLILEHLQKNKKGYVREFKDVFSDLRASDISNLLRELKKDGKIKHTGSRKAGFWTLK